MSDEEIAMCRSIEYRRDAAPGYAPEPGLSPIVHDIDVNDEPALEPDPEPPLVPGQPPVDPFADGIEPSTTKKKRVRPKPARV
jgi:hypothetical protein